MKLASLKSSTSKDGQLIVVSKDNKRAVLAKDIAPHMQYAMDHWDQVKTPLQKLYEQLNASSLEGEFLVDEEALHSPLPRSHAWLDGSAFLHHVRLVRKARNAPLPETLETDPLMYQGGSDDFLPPRGDIPQVDFSHGTDFEGEVAVITGDIPMGATPEECEKQIRLVVLVNDVSLRGLIPEELAKGFGFLISKPSSAFSPFAVSLEDLKDHWKEGKLHLPLHVTYNNEFFGKANAGDMFFSFPRLLSHIAQTRNISAGTILGSGTVSNENPEVGSSCLAERRMIEIIESGKASTPFMKVGDQIQIEMFDPQGNNIFGTIKQKVVSA